MPYPYIRKAKPGDYEAFPSFLAELASKPPIATQRSNNLK